MKLTIDEVLQRGVVAHKEGKLQEAERLYRVILQSQPLHPDANHNLGLLAVSVNKADTALPLFKAALEANPKIEQFWLSYIDALIKERQFENAKKVIEQGKMQGIAGEKLRALETRLTPKAQVSEPKLAAQKKRLALSEKPKKLVGHKRQKTAKKQNLKAINPPQEQLNSLLQHYQNGRYGDAEKLAKSITQEFPSHYFGWKCLAAVLKQTGRVSESLVASQKLMQLAPKDAEAHYNLGNTLQELGKLDEAEASYSQAIALKPDMAEAHNNLANTLRELGRLDEAEAGYKKAIALKPDFADAHSCLGTTLKELNRLDEAEASYNQALVLRPNFAEAYNNLGILLKELGRLDEAEASCNQALALKPNFAAAYNNLSIILRDLGRSDEAEVNCRQAIKLQPDYAEAYYNLGTTLKELGRLEEAETSYARAIKLEPDDFPHAYDELGVILQMKGEFEQAEVYYRRYTSLEPNVPSAIVSKGSILFNKGDFEGALSVFDSYADVTSRACALESLYALGRIEDIYERIEAQADLYGENLRVAAIAAFLAEREKKNTAHNFCNNPINFIHFANISSHVEDPDLFIAAIIDELRGVKTSWEPNARTTKNGFQASIDVFKNPFEKMSSLKSIIIDELNSYYAKFKNESCSYIKKWPSEKNVTGWHVILKQKGHQTAHIHPNGWLSGVIYLKVVPSLGNDEGAIEFSLNSPNYSDVGSPKKAYQPKLGDMVFFPSSLHHRTVPYSTDTDRICISFDLMPGAKL